MALPAPNLDDRTFQNLVDDAKRIVQQRCPEWTDHNVSDPGVTLIELFAFMTDQLIYRLNRVPDRQYIKFLELIDVTLFPPTAARTDVSFRLTGPRPGEVTIAAGTQVATQRTETDDAITFTTTADLKIVPTSRVEVGSILSVKASRYRDLTEDLDLRKAAACFQEPPKPGDALLVGLSRAAPSNTVRLRFKCELHGSGIEPGHEPLAWEAWDGEDWVPCDRESDSTLGLNQDGEVILHLPKTHAMHTVDKREAAWLRAVALDPEEGMFAYDESPKIRDVIVETIGGTVEATNASLVRDEDLGLAEGVPNQVFPLRRRPVVASDHPPVLAVSVGEEPGEEPGWEEWLHVADFASSGPDDRHFTLNVSAGEARVGPVIRQEDGTLLRYGATPKKGRRLRMLEYRTGGGAAGNVAAGTLRIMKSSIPFVASVTNRRDARGGVDGEDIENAKLRGPIRLRTRGRAVTAEDYEHLAREAAPQVARVRAVPIEEAGKAGAVRVLIVPAATSESGRLRFDQLAPDEPTLAAIQSRLDDCRIVGTRVAVEPPQYRGIIVQATIEPAPGVKPTRLKTDAERALYDYLHAITGGHDRTGWPFGRPVTSGEVYSILQAVPGAGVVDEVHLFRTNPEVPDKPLEEVQRLDLPSNALIFSGTHAVTVPGAE